jgi:hypothetical protein
MKNIKKFDKFLIKEALAVSPREIMDDISKKLDMNVDTQTKTIEYYTIRENDLDHFQKSVRIKDIFMTQNGKVKATVDLFNGSLIGTEKVTDLETFLTDFFSR